MTRAASATPGPDPVSAPARVSAFSPVGAQLFTPPSTSATWRGDGSVILRSRTPLGAYADSMAQLFRAAADANPDRVLVAQRDGHSWRTITYGAARRQIDGLAQALLDEVTAGASAGAAARAGASTAAGAAPSSGAGGGSGTARPVLILSGNSIEHLLLTLACYTIGSPVVPVSTAYSLLATDYAKLRAMADLIGPAVVFAADGDAYADALEAVSGGRAVITSSGRAGREYLGRFDELAATAPTGRVEERFAAVGPDTVAKILFTSGSTGHPKGVINTHRMLCANQQMIRQAWPFLADEPPVLLDWLPWSHTFGGNHNLHQVIANAGSLWIDDGRPAPGMIERTVRNLADVSPTIYYSVPAGYGALLPFLQADAELARRFFARLRIAFFAAAALPQQLWDAIGALAAATGSAAPMTTSWGATETAPAATSAHFASGRSDCIGVPLPGVTVKLSPVAERMEIRVQGPTVTPGYLGAPDQTEAAFDAEGFYLTGDAVQLMDRGDPNAGLRFDGRIAEDFKLATGTWVRVGTLRVALLSAADGLLQDVVLTGRDAEFIGALGWLNPGQAARIARSAAGPSGAGPSEPPDAAVLVADPGVRTAAATALGRLNAGRTGSSQRIERLLLLTEPASFPAGEITDKGYLNQRAVLERRAEFVAAVHARSPGPEIIQPVPSSGQLSGGRP